jgi:SMODS-associated and fused to various effectors sensor domain
VANQVIPRLNGDEYQHLYSWWHALALLRRRDRVTRVRVEDADGGSVDDVTVHHEPGSGKPEEFYHYFFQVKYHENQAQHYSSAKLQELKANGRSLLQKFFDTWKKLGKDHPGRQIKIHLVSNWSWSHEADKIGRCLNSQEGKLSDEFLSCGPRSDIGRVREQWKAHIGATPEEFSEFINSLHLQLGEGSFRQLRQMVSERMEHVGLKHDMNALASAVDIIRIWIRTKLGDITLEVMERVLKERDLYLPPASEQCVTVHLNTITEGAFDLEPDFVLDWRKYFEGRPDLKGHQLKDPTNWNKKLLPELRNVLADVRRTTKCRLVRTRGLARLSAWFAFGFTFSEVAGYTLEVQQQDQHWRTDAPPSADFRILTTSGVAGEQIIGQGATVACGISVTGLLDDDVRKHIATPGGQPIAALLLLRPERELGRSCLRGAADAVALARGVKDALRGFTKRWDATRLLLYYFGPLSGACFIGHQLNAVCREVQIMEDQQPGYAPAFLLQ